MVQTMLKNVVQLLHLVQLMKVTVTVTLNAKEILSVGQTIVLLSFTLKQIAVNPLLVRIYNAHTTIFETKM